MDREQAMNLQVQIDNIDREMNVINRLAKAYMNATPEQRANVNEGDMRAQIERYKELKNQKAVLQEQRAAAELLAARQAAEAEAARQAQLNTRGTWRRAPNTNRQTLTNKQYRNRLNELAEEQAAWEQANREQIITPVEPITVSIDWAPITTWGQTNNNWYFTWPITWRQFRRPVTIWWQVVWSPYPINWNSIIPGYVNNRWLWIVDWPTWESILSWSNISEVDIWNNYTPAPINIAPTNEQFRISQVIGWHTYEYWDNGSVKIDWVLQRAWNWTDYIITQPRVNTWGVNTWNLSILTWWNWTWHISNPLFIWWYQR